MAACLHRSCGRKFGGVAGFDRHLRVLEESPWVECVDPASVGLRFKDGVWMQPSPNTRLG